MPQLKKLKNEVNIGASDVAIIDSDDHYLHSIRDVLAQVDGEYDIYYYNMVTKHGYFFTKDETNRYSWPGQFKIILRSFIGNVVFTKGKDIARDCDFNRALMDRNPKSKYTDICLLVQLP